MVDTLLHRIGVLAEEKRDKKALIFKKESLSYEELYERVLCIASYLREQGVRPGDCVCFSAVSKPEMAAVYLAIHACGGVAVFLDKSGTPEHMADIYKTAGAVLLLTDKPMKEAGEGCRILSLKETYASDCAPIKEIHSFSEEETADILFTSGTTGRPKGVMLSYRAVYNILTNTIRGCGYSENTVMLLPLPLNHSFALRVLRAILYSGGTIVLQNGFTFAREAENNILSFNCNSIACVPASYEMMKNQMQDKFPEIMRHLKSFEAGAGSLSVGQRQELTKTLPDARIMNVWGSSESGGAIFCNVSEAVKNEETAGSLGRATDGVEVVFLSKDTPFEEPEKMRGHMAEYIIDSSRDNPGRMAIKGDMIMSGYWEDPVKSAESLVDGWLLTGDMAYQDDKGNIFMLGRADDLINFGGEKVSPIEIENLVSLYDKVEDCACIGVEDEVTGQIPVLFIVTGIGFNNTEFQKWLSGKIEKTKLPQKTVVVEEIPRNRMKKIDRQALHRMWEDQGSLSLINPVIDAILSRRSIRLFTDREIPGEMLDLIIKCGYHAPSGKNMQSWRFTVLTKKDDIENLKKSASETARNNNVKMYGFENPKALILISNDVRNPHSCQDASCAAENIMLSARSLGLGSTWINVLMDLRSEEPVKTLLDSFGIPDNHKIWAMIALGWPQREGIKTEKNAMVVHFV